MPRPIDRSKPVQFHRNQAVKAQDIERELDLYVHGKAIDEIASIMNEGKDENQKISQMMVYHDLKGIINEWRERHINNSSVILAKEMARLDRLEQQYWDAWNESKKPLTHMDKETYQIESDGGRYDSSKRTKTREMMKFIESHGQVEFLQGIERVIDLRFKLLGIGQTKNININWREQAKRAGVDPDEIIDAMVTQIVDIAPDEDNPLLGGGEVKEGYIEE